MIVSPARHCGSSAVVDGVKVLAQENGDDGNWQLWHGDSVEVVQGIPDDSLGFSVYSPPFASLYTYSNSERDMGNCKSNEEFSQHFRYLIAEQLRATMPGRLSSVHCMLLPATKQSDGYIGLKDFRSEIIRDFIDDEAAEFHRAIVRYQERLHLAHVQDDVQRVNRLDAILDKMLEELRDHPPSANGWIYHSEVVIWKDPVTAMQRTKALGLLHKQIVKDSCRSRQGIPDYVCTFRKPGDNPEPVEGELDRWIGDDSFRSEGRLSIDLWQRYASPVWSDIDMGRTLQHRAAREASDERHICALQLDVIERCLELWSNPGDVILSPFAGIGSEGWCSVARGRKFVGCELKGSYFQLACKNLRAAEEEARKQMLF